jgi:transcriptional regulator with XRE-family HTH domain
MTTARPVPHIRELRSARAWSQEQLAQIAGINVRTIQRIEKGKPASVETLKSIASAFEIDVTRLLEPKKPTQRKRQEPVGEFLRRVENGTQLFAFFGATHAYQFENDELHNDAQADLVGSFLQELHDWGETWDEIEPGERVRASHDFTSRIAELEELRLWVFAGRTRRKVAAGAKPLIFDVLVVQVHHSDNPTIIKIDPSKASVFAEAKE